MYGCIARKFTRIEAWLFFFGMQFSCGYKKHGYQIIFKDSKRYPNIAEILDAARLRKQKYPLALLRKDRENINDRTQGFKPI